MDSYSWTSKSGYLVRIVQVDDNYDVVGFFGDQPFKGWYEPWSMEGDEEDIIVLKSDIFKTNGKQIKTLIVPSSVSCDMYRNVHCAFGGNIDAMSCAG